MNCVESLGWGRWDDARKRDWLSVCVTESKFYSNERKSRSHSRSDFVLYKEYLFMFVCAMTCLSVDDQPFHTLLVSLTEKTIHFIVNLPKWMFVHGFSNGFKIIINLLWYSLLAVPSMKPH